MASERERADVRERRRGWIDKRLPRMRLQPARLVFIDETAVNTKMTRLRGRSRRGQRLRAVRSTAFAVTALVRSLLDHSPISRASPLSRHVFTGRRVVMPTRLRDFT